MARIAIGGFLHETNCFVPGVTDYEQFARPADRPGILRGEVQNRDLFPTVRRHRDTRRQIVRHRIIKFHLATTGHVQHQ